MVEAARLARREHSQEDDLAIDRQAVSAIAIKKATDTIRAKLSASEAELTKCFQILPMVPEKALCWDGRNLYPHVEAVSDEFSIMSAQLDASEARVAELEKALSPLANCSACDEGMPHTHYADVDAIRSALSPTPIPEKK